VTTAVAFELFRRASVDIAVIEVGLGGRLDATNVIDPLLTAITSIAFDHQQYLGSSLAEIAGEKAGIVKPGVPMIVGELDAEPYAAIARIARERGAPLVRAAEGVTVDARADGGTIRLRTPVRDYGDVTVGLAGTHQIRNAVIAVRMLELLDGRGIAVPPHAIVSALARPSWPGRLDLRKLADGRELLLDAAHNPAGASALASYLRERGSERLPLVFAAMRDKDMKSMLREILPAVGPLVATRASNRRSAEPELIAEIARGIAPERPITIAAAPDEALEFAWRLSPRIVVAGSIFLLGDVMRATRQLVIPFENGS